MFPMSCPVWPTAEEVAREIIFQEKASRAYTSLKQTGYDIDKVIEHYHNNCRPTLEALVQATSNGELSVDEGRGREIWRELIADYASKPPNERDGFSQVYDLYLLCRPPLSYGVAYVLGELGLMAASMLSFGIVVPGFISYIKTSTKLRDSINLKYLKKRLGLK